MTQDSAAVPPATGATREEIVEKLEAAFGQIAAQLDVPLEKVRNLANRRHIRLKKSERRRRNQTICRLRSDGYSNEAIAEALGLSLASVNQTIVKLIAEGKIERRRATDEEMSEREEQIIKLREDGYSNKAIAEELELSVPSITQMVSKLIQEGRVTPQRRGRNPLTDEDRQEREEQIIKLREDGYSNKAIAEALGLSPGTIGNWAHQLIEDGRTENRCDENATCRDIESERVQIIISMQKQRATLKEVGDALGVTRERARQLINKVAAEHGKEVLEPDSPLLTAREAADELGVTPNIINQLCASGEVACRRRGVNEEGTYLIDEAEVEKLRTHPAITQERTCVICGGLFTTGGTIAITCSEKCSEVRRQQKRESPTPDSLEEWRKDLWQRLQKHRLRKNEEWITESEAVRRTGLTKGQFLWLRRRNIITFRPHPERKCRGQAVMTYAASQVEITRQVFEAYEHRNGNHD